MNAQETKNPTAKNIFAILGFIILLIIGIWSAIQVIKFVPRLFSETGTTSQVVTDNGIKLGNRDIVVELSKDTANSGEPITLTWAHNGDANGVLSFAYACEEGFYFQIAGRPVPCNAPYNIPVTDTSLEVTPLSAKDTVEAPFAITYTNTDNESIRDTKTLTVLNADAQEDVVAATKENTDKGPVEPKPVVTKKPATVKPVTQVAAPVVKTIRVPRTSDPYGTADLKAEVIAIGDINQYGAFEPKGIVHPYARGGVKFKVTNLGTKETGTWYFSAVLPTQGGYPFNSVAQQSLMPGSSVEIFMTFDQLVPGIHNFTVHVDPANYIYEWSDHNNVAGQTLTVLNY